MTEIKAGSPYNWISLNYGTIAVHVDSIYNGIATITIDGGEAATPAQRFPELSDGRFHVVIASGKLHKRPARRAPKKAVTVADVPGVKGAARVAVTAAPKRTTKARAEAYASQHKLNSADRAAMVAGIEKATAQVEGEVTF
jgi:hypothetical protein